MLIILLVSITFVSLCASSYFPRISRLRGFLCSDYKLQAKQKITRCKLGNGVSEKLLVSSGASFKDTPYYSIMIRTYTHLYEPIRTYTHLYEPIRTYTNLYAPIRPYIVLIFRRLSANKTKINIIYNILL